MFQQPPPTIAAGPIQAAQSSLIAPPPVNQIPLLDAGQSAAIQPQQLNVAGLQPGIQQPLPNGGGLPIIQPQAFSTPSHHTSYLPEWAGQPHTDPNIQLTPAAALRALPREDQARVIWRSNPQDLREGLLRDSLAQYGVSFNQPGPPDGMAFQNSNYTNNAGMIPTNSPASPLTPFNQVSTSSCAPVIFPNFDSKVTFADEPLESWSGFIEHWEVDMLTYSLDDRQLAMCLPKSLRGSAYQKYTDLINQRHPSIRSYLALKEELGKFFLRHNTMKGRSLFTLIQGKKSVREFCEIE